MDKIEYFQRGQVNELNHLKKEIKITSEKNLFVSSVKEIYNALLEKLIEKNGSLIPSRNEKRIRCVQWKNSWKNLSLLRGVGVEERTFAWKMSQDMLDVGSRIHRKGAIKECKKELDRGGTGVACNQIETLKHRPLNCETVNGCYVGLKRKMAELLGRGIEDDEIICLCFNHRNKHRLQVVIWAVVKILYQLFIREKADLGSLWNFICDEIQWNITQNIIVGSKIEMIRLRTSFLKIN